MNQIDQLHFRLSGMAAEDAQALAKEVSGELARQIPEMSRDVQLGDIRIQLNAASVQNGSLAKNIAAQIIRQIHETIASGQ